MKTDTKLSTKYIALMALFIALSFIGANIRIFGSIAFDSLPAFLAALLLGPLPGAVIGFIGHLLTALMSGFPLSAPLHLVIALAMAITMLGFGCTYRALKNRMRTSASLAITGIVGVLLNGPVSLGFTMVALALIAGAEAAWGLLALLAFLMLASVVNVVASIALFKPLERIWDKHK